LDFNHLHAELNPICHLLALLGAHHVFHVSGLRVEEEFQIDNPPDSRALLLYVTRTSAQCHS